MTPKSDLFDRQAWNTLFRIAGDPCPPRPPWQDGRRCGACGGFGAMWQSHDRPWSGCGYCQPGEHRQRCDVWRCHDEAVWWETTLLGEFDLCEYHGRGGMTLPPRQRTLEAFAS